MNINMENERQLELMLLQREKKTILQMFANCPITAKMRLCADIAHNLVCIDFT